MNRKVPEAVIETHDDEIDLLELWKTIWNGRKFITYFTGTAVLLTIIISLFISNKYRAESTLLPVAANNSGMLGDLAGMAALAGINVGGGGDNSAKVMVVANSRTVKEQVIKELGLTKIIVEDIPDKRDPMQYTIEKFNELLNVTADKKTGVITIGFEWEDPKLASDIVNSYVKALQDVLESKALSIDKMQRVFFERKLKEEKAKFSEQKHTLASFQKRSKMIEPVEQAKGTMSLYSALMAQKIALELQMQGLEAALSSENPRLIAVKNQVAAINRKIKSIEGTTNEGALLSLGNAPDKMIEYTDIMEGLKTSQGVYETLIKLYEKSKLDEAKSDLYVEVIDQAIPPDKKIKPKRSLMVAVAGMTSVFISVFIVFFMEWIGKVKGSNGIMRRN